MVTFFVTLFYNWQSRLFNRFVPKKDIKMFNALCFIKRFLTLHFNKNNIVFSITRYFRIQYFQYIFLIRNPFVMLCIQITKDFLNVRLSSSPLKITSLYYKTLSLGVCYSNINVEHSCYIEYIQTYKNDFTLRYIIIDISTG